MGFEDMFCLVCFHLGGVLRVSSYLAPRQALRSHPVGQLEQRAHSHSWLGFLRQLGAVDRVEHPARQGDLFAVIKSDDIDLSDEAALGSNHSAFRAVARVVAVFDSARRQLMSSMRRR